MQLSCIAINSPLSLQQQLQPAGGHQTNNPLTISTKLCRMRCFTRTKKPTTISCLPTLLLLLLLQPHRAPVADMAIDASGGYLATGSADRAIKVTDLAGGYVTHHFTGHG
jgi:WD40 repeat protein